jgi:hypothetical protein
MVHHRLVRVHDAAGKDAINERLSESNPLSRFEAFMMRWSQIDRC